jgi:uncharacterized protein (DUF2235 family)
MKRIIICCDGTWNSADQTTDGIACPTNVAKIAQLVTPTAPDLAAIDDPTKVIHQVVYYHEGVGTGNQIDKIEGGAFGVGLSGDIEHCYRFLVNNYNDGDELFIFGFSRGAYMARSLVGLLHNSGLLTKKHSDKFDLAYQIYKDRSEGTSSNAPIALTFRQQFCWPNISIKFLGVWDTVGALGVPDFILSKLLGNQWKFHDISLSPIVLSASHALAMDEKREDFKPSPWDKPNDADFQQVWFAGVHSDIGGGYPETGLSDVSLHWMIGRALGQGLNLDLTSVSIVPNPFSMLHDSKTGLFALKPDYHRVIDPSVMHASVQQRIAKVGTHYTPVNLPANPTYI